MQSPTNFSQFPANIKQVNQSIFKILSTSSSLELQLVGSSCKECRLIKLIAHKYLELIVAKISSGLATPLQS